MIKRLRFLSRRRFWKLLLVTLFSTGVLYIAFIFFIFLYFHYEIKHDPISRIPKIVIYGDTRTYHDTHRKIVEMIRSESPSVVFHTGDLMTHGWGLPDWFAFHRIEKELIKETDYYATLGNHEHNSLLYYLYFDFPGNEEYYSVDRYGIHFTVLNSTGDLSKDSEQYKWFVHDLRDHKDAAFKFVIFHHPLYSRMKVEDEMNIGESILPIMKKFKVHAVFNAHLHSYERSYVDGIHHIITAGGGAPLRGPRRENDYSKVYVRNYHYTKMYFEGDELVYKAIDIDGKEIDSLRFYPHKDPHYNLVKHKRD
ncbi:metallophosphoesterase family protein [Limisalsivibrio acetivorans]|uniref:metallophosphoesterase family protein n=1 Tax=Limisalsivibrio acetivorans TaxID=1304888 RepID=UPI0003B7478D|nr:metallophosphoesterase [Limisalsivibrio acetivorans]